MALSALGRDIGGSPPPAVANAAALGLPARHDTNEEGVGQHGECRSEAAKGART